MPTKVEWCARPETTPESWNPVTGCDVDGKRVRVSPGCDHCWAERMARRLAGRFGYPGVPHHFDVMLHPDRLEEPLHWRKPRTVFVCSMGDLFHEDVPWEFIKDVFTVIGQSPHHTYLILTKRPRRMAALQPHIWGELSNVWLGVTVESQDEMWRVEYLRETPAAVRFLSLEPLLGPIDLRGELWDGDIHWVIVGGESGPGARPMHPDWVRSVRDQCQAAGVPFFFKQWGKWQHSSQVEFWPYRKGSRLYEWPDGTVSVAKHKRRTGRELDCREWNEWPG